MTYACFITSHGFGHAARAAGIMQALLARRPETRFALYTMVPEWFFQQSIGPCFSYHPTACDVGLVQHSTFEADLPATADRLDAWLPGLQGQADALARHVRGLGCTLALCDIAPLGIAVARAAGIPGVLVENFTWHCIYRGYQAQEPRLGPHADLLEALAAQADVHVQTEPVTERSAHPDLITAPVARRTREPRQAIRRRLGISGERPVVVLTMGGIESSFDYLRALAERLGIWLLTPGSVPALRCEGTWLSLPWTAWYHPDLVNAADALVGKLGYSTLAECYHSGVPYGFIPRQHFAESARLASYASRHMMALSIEQDALIAGRLDEPIRQLLALPRRAGERGNGADTVADFLLGACRTSLAPTGS